jgi:hypothetical protein
MRLFAISFAKIAVILPNFIYHTYRRCGGEEADTATEMHIERTDSLILVSTDLAEGTRQMSLRFEDARRLIAGESILRNGLIIRRLGNIVELRTASPGIAMDRRVLSTSPIEQFLSA